MGKAFYDPMSKLQKVKKEHFWDKETHYKLFFTS